jgi:hypothetical protein
MQPMYYIGLDVHKKKISYCVKDGGGQVYSEGQVPNSRNISCKSSIVRLGSHAKRILSQLFPGDSMITRRHSPL